MKAPRSLGRSALALAVAFAASVLGLPDTSGSPHVAAETAPDFTQSDLLGPAGSVSFGSEVLVLSNGNFVVADPDWNGAGTERGIVRLYDGTTETIIDEVEGATDGDRIGTAIVEVGNSNFVIRSSELSTAAGANVGAVTWGDGETGFDGAVIGVGNSLVGNEPNSGNSKTILVLENGNYVVMDSGWSNGADRVGAVTWADGNVGVTGTANITNSLVGSTRNDLTGAGMTPLANGDYVVAATRWDRGGIVDAGAVTLADGETGIAGVISTANSLVGQSAGDKVGSVTELASGDLVVASPRWDGAFEDLGAVTWVDRSIGTVGEVSVANSLTGASEGDGVGGVTPLPSGHYVVFAPLWNGPLAENVGAVRIVDGSSPVTGTLSASDSLTGSQADDRVGGGIAVLSNGNLVVQSSSWDRGTTRDAGAVTWIDASVGLVGEVDASNSLVGSSRDDSVGFVTPLANGNYVVTSNGWDDGATVDVGAATLADGSSGIVGEIDVTNSLVGSAAGDRVGGPFGGVTALANGNYVVRSYLWSGGGPDDAGALTWGDGATGTIGVVSAANSLVGTAAGDRVGGGLTGVVAPLPNGDYIVGSPEWSGGGASMRGALTLGDGTGGSTVGAVSAANSLIGTDASDEVGEVGGVVVFDDSSYVAISKSWNGGRGAASLGVADDGVVGPITPSNSAIGTLPGSIDVPDARLTANDSVAIPTTQNRVIMMRLDREPFFPTPPADVTAATAPGATSATVTFSTPVADDLRDATSPTATCAPASGSSFPVGDTTVTCSATDSKGLTGSTSFVVTVTATPPVDPDPGPDVVSLTPGRVLETRPGEDTVDGVAEGDGRVGAGSEIVVPVAGRAGVAGDAVAAVLNVTAINPSGRGFVTIHPCGSRPLASSLNYAGAGAVVGNEVVAKLSATGSVCIYTSAETHLTADVVGYVPAGSPVTSLTPGRVLETRPGEDTVDGVAEGDGRVGAGSEIVVPVAGRAGVAGDAVAAVLNVTAINPSGRGFVTIHPCGTRPLASSLNYAGAGAVVGNEVVAKLSATGSVCIYTSAETHLTADVVGYVPADAATTSLTPGRVLETRAGEDTVDGVAEGDGRVGSMEEIEVPIAGRAGVPASGAGAVIMNVTAINPSGRGFVTIHPCGTRPLASSLNYAGAGAVAGNEVIAKLSGGGSVCIYTSAETHLTADVVGYIPA